MKYNNSPKPEIETLRQFLKHKKSLYKRNVCKGSLNNTYGIKQNEVLYLDFYFYATRQLKLHQSVNSFRS